MGLDAEFILSTVMTWSRFVAIYDGGKRFHMDTPALPGDVLLGKYRVERVLGQGGMGFVVAARHVELGQLYAIKFLLPNVVVRHEALERFLREARAAAQLKSEHVARVHDVGRMDDGSPYMIMEHLDGCDLKVHVSRQGPLPVEEAVTYVLHACDAISEAHALGIIHRDLKPANLFLVRRRNGSPCVKVLDFGISKTTGPEEVDLTNTNMLLGSPLYMSPEQMSKTKTVDGRTDIWALGAILYELLTGNSPFRAGSMLEVAAKVLQEEPRPLRDVCPDVPERIVELIARCLRKRRDDRWATIDDFAQALEEFVPRAPPSRLPMISVTNLEGASVATSAPQAVASVLTAVDVMFDPMTSVGAPMGEPTSITFGQTGKPKVVRRRRTAALGGFVAAGLVMAGGAWMKWGGSSERDAAQEATDVADAAVAASAMSSVSSTPILVFTEQSLRAGDTVIRGDQPKKQEGLAGQTKAKVEVGKTKPTAPVKVVTPAALPPTTLKTSEPTATGTTKKNRRVD